MPLETIAPSWWEWVLLAPSLLVLMGLLRRGLREESPMGWAGRWSFLDFLIVILVHYLAAFSLGALVDIPFLPRSWAVGATLLAADAIICCAVIGVTALAGNPTRVLGLVPPRGLRNGLAVALAYLAFIVPLDILAWSWLEFLSSLGLSPTMQTTLELYVDARAQGDWAGISAIAAGAVAMAPVAEELLFRGFIFGILRRRAGPWAAVLLASAIFAAFHLKLEVLLPIFVMGVLLNGIYLRTGTLAYPILFHAIFNGGTLVIAWSKGM